VSCQLKRAQFFSALRENLWQFLGLEPGRQPEFDETNGLEVVASLKVPRIGLKEGKQQ
jgi:hypothetical protein